MRTKEAKLCITLCTATQTYDPESPRYNDWKHYDKEIDTFTDDLEDAIHDWVSVAHCLRPADSSPRPTALTLGPSAILQEIARIIGASLVFAIVFRIFKLCNQVHALRNITMTVSMAMSKLVSFGLIVALLVAIFAGAAMLAYGPELEEFHTYPEAIVTTLVVMSTGG